MMRFASIKQIEIVGEAASGPKLRGTYTTDGKLNIIIR
jgi:hypothetical protein